MSIKVRIKHANARHWPQHLFYAPEWIVLGVNNRCNMHCKMCDVGLGNVDTTFYQNLMGAKPVNMPLDLFQRVVDEVAACWPKTWLGLAFTEPLIYPELLPALRYAHAHGLNTGLTTNGLQLDKKADALADAGLTRLFVSLDGPADVHNEIRGHPHGFERAMAGLETLFHQARYPGVQISCVITAWNSGRLVEFAEGFRRLPLEGLHFMHALFTPKEVADAHNARHGARYPATPSNLGEHDAQTMDFAALHRELAAVRALALPFPVTFSPHLRDEAALRTFYLEPGVPIGRSCSDVSRTLMIKSDGSAIPAHGRCYNLAAGNVYRKSLRAIWNGAPLRTLRHDLHAAGGLLPACARCCSAFGA